MDFKSLLGPLLAPAFAKGLIWATRQGEGTDRGNRDLAKNSVLLNAAANVAGSLTGAALTNAATHGILGKANDALAKASGLATTEQAIASVVGANNTLPLSQNLEAGLASYLESTMIK